MIEGIKFAIKLSETKALRRFGVKLDKTPVTGCENIKFGCDAYWECAVRMQTGPENHQAGSCKMGPRGDPTAVVDNLLQVRVILVYISMLLRKISLFATFIFCDATTINPTILD